MKLFSLISYVVLLSGLWLFL